MRLRGYLFQCMSEHFNSLIFEHAGAVLFVGACGQGGFVRGACHMAGAALPQPAGDLPRDLPQLCRREGGFFFRREEKICQTIKNLYNKYDFILEGDCLNGDEKEAYRKVSAEMEDYVAASSLKCLSDYLAKHYGKKAIILLDDQQGKRQKRA